MKQSYIKIGENDIGMNDMPALNWLLRQLNHASPVARFEDVGNIMRSDTIVTLRDATKDNVLVGMGMLIATRKLLYLFGNIEEIVVDEPYRGFGWGKTVMECLIYKGKVLGMKFIVLSSSPDKIVANKLYRSMGFEIPNTNFYRLYY